MSFKERKNMYKALEKERKNPLIVYITSIRPGLSTSMAGDSISFIIEQINAIDKDADEIDFMIISNGGDPIAALRINSLLKERFKKINVLVPYVAYSAATIFSLGADSIVMGQFSNLGPIDPQIVAQKKDDKGAFNNLQFGSEDLRYFIEFVKKDIGIRKGKHVLKACEQLINDVGGNTIGFAKRSQQLSLFLSEKLLSEHHYPQSRINSIVKRLNSSFHHGYAVSRTEAIEMGLKVEKPSIKVEELMWKIWKDFEEEMKCNNPFDPLNEVISNPVLNQKLNSVPVISIPANLPSQTQQIIAQQFVNQIQVSTQTATHINALAGCIESSRCGFQYCFAMNILAWRNFDMQIGMNITTIPSGWKVI